MMYFEISDFNALRTALHRLEESLLKEHLSEDFVFTGKLVADELLSNVLQHGGKKAYFKVSLTGDELLLSVKSEDGFRPPEKSTLAEPLAESGRGLFLVDALCARREYTEEDGVKVFLKIER